MSKFSRFMKANKIKKENELHAVTASLTDENGKPLEWEFKHISSRENEELKDKCTIEVQVKGKPNLFRPRLNTSKYLRELICASVVVPDLYNKELQDSYGVMSPEDLLHELVDAPGEYNDLEVWIQEFHGFTKTMDEKVDEAKN